jgi:hypothetical protein
MSHLTSVIRTQCIITDVEMMSWKPKIHFLITKETVHPHYKHLHQDIYWSDSMTTSCCHKEKTITEINSLIPLRLY